MNENEIILNRWFSLQGKYIRYYEKKEVNNIIKIWKRKKKIYKLKTKNKNKSGNITLIEFFYFFFILIDFLKSKFHTKL